MGSAKQQGKRSPLKQKPLRVPGESLGEERERILDDQLLQPFLAAVFLILWAGLEWWRSLTDAPPQPVVVSLLALLAVVFFTFRFRKVRSRLRALRLGLEGEKAVGQLLEASRQPGWHVFHDVPGNGFNIDHVLVAPHGIFAVETKTFSKPTKGEAVVMYDGEKVLVNGLQPDRNPVAQARAVHDWLCDLLFESTGIRYPVRGVVVFPGWWVESPKSGKRPDVWVLNDKAFVKFVEKEPAVIRPEDVALASSRLVLHITR